MIKLFLLFFILCPMASAELMGDVVLKSVEIVKFNDKTVVVRGSKGNLEIPRSYIKNSNFLVGNKTDLILDAKDYERLKAEYILKPLEVNSKN